MARVLLLFVDGVGLGGDDAAVNPFLRAALPGLRALLELALITADGAPHFGDRASLIAVDATLGYDGIPQSGTGQAALLTGENAVELHGGHFGPWIPSRLRSLVREQNVLTRAHDLGLTTAFANAYPEEVLTPAASLPSDQAGHVPRRAASFLRAGPPLAALGAGVLTRHTPELISGEAVASEITNDGWRERLGRIDVPDITAREAGLNLARIARRYDLTLFAHYATDYAGHRRDMDEAVRALERLDAFIDGVLAELADDVLLLVVSDHGNIEDVRVGHTRNPALGIVAGPGHATVAHTITSLTDVAPAVLRALRPAAAQPASPD